MALHQRINLYLSRNVKIILKGEGLSLVYVLSPDAMFPTLFPLANESPTLHHRSTVPIILKFSTPPALPRHVYCAVPSTSPTKT